MPPVPEYTNSITSLASSGQVKSYSVSYFNRLGFVFVEFMVSTPISSKQNRPTFHGRGIASTPANERLIVHRLLWYKEHAGAA